MNFRNKNIVKILLLVIYSMTILTVTSCGIQSAEPKKEADKTAEQTKNDNDKTTDETAEEEIKNADSPDSEPTGDEFLVASLGDSITAGFLAGETKNWATGGELISDGSALSHGSYSEKIREYFKENQINKTIKTENFAVSGDRVEDLRAQVDQMILKKPDLVTLLIGANDVCSSGITEDYLKGDFKTLLKESVATIFSGEPADRPKSMVVGSIPDIPMLKEIGTFASNSQCIFAWNVGCGNLLDLSAADFRVFIALANDMLSDVATESSAAGFPVVYDEGALNQINFVEEEIAFDCFHPSPEGQRKISETIWNSTEQQIKEIIGLP